MPHKTRTIKTTSWLRSNSSDAVALRPQSSEFGFHWASGCSGQLRRPRLMGCLGDALDAHGMRPKFFSSQFHSPPPSELGLSWIPSLQWSPAAVWRKDALSHHLESLVHTFSGPFSPAAHLAAFMCSVWTSMGEQLADHAQSQPETRHGSPSARTEIEARAIWVQQIRFELLRHIGTRQIVLRFCQGELVTKTEVCAPSDGCQVWMAKELAVHATNSM